MTFQIGSGGTHSNYTYKNIEKLCVQVPYCPNPIFSANPGYIFTYPSLIQSSKHKVWYYDVTNDDDRHHFRSHSSYGAAAAATHTVGNFES